MKNSLARRFGFGGLLGAAGSLALTCGAFADHQDHPPAPVVPFASQPAPRLHVDQPLPDPLAKGLVVIRYRTENLRIVPVFGPNARDVSPRIGHIHVTVDDASWHWADASGEPLIIQGLATGAHKMLIELADPTHKVIGGKTVHPEVPPVHAGRH